MSEMTIEQVIINSSQQKPPPKKRRTPWWLPAVWDVIIAGIVLCTFALFHHVLPKAHQPAEPVDPPTSSQENQTPNNPEDTSLGSKFKDKFTATPVSTETSYSSKNFAVFIEKRTLGEGKNLVTYYVADVYLRSIDCFQTAFAKDTYGSNIKENMIDIANRHHAVFAVSGDYYGMHANKSVIRNGKLYREKSGDEDVCVVYRDGSMRMITGGTFDASKEIENDAWQAFSFGPSLLNGDGTPKTKFSGYLAQAHPRCAIGYYEPGHYAFVLVDGRQENYSVGLTLKELAALFESMGCTAAYNLDGGQTAMMAFNGTVVNRPYKNGRKVSDIIFFGEVAEN